MVLAHEKYIDHPLFRKCIEISCPDGWLFLLDELVELIEHYNKVQGTEDVGFAQVKTKFGFLVSYLEYYGTDRNNLEWSKKIHGEGLYEKISSICSRSMDYCAVCGKEKTEMVYDTKIKKVCFEHYSKSTRLWPAI